MSSVVFYDNRLQAVFEAGLEDEANSLNLQIACLQTELTTALRERDKAVAELEKFTNGFNKGFKK